MSRILNQRSRAIDKRWSRCFRNVSTFFRLLYCKPFHHGLSNVCLTWSKHLVQYCAELKPNNELAALDVLLFRLTILPEIGVLVARLDDVLADFLKIYFNVWQIFVVYLHSSIIISPNYLTAISSIAKFTSKLRSNVA